MPLFVCTECRAIENTALGHYWMSGTVRPGRGSGPPLCSECDPAQQRWHGRFPKVIATPEILDERGREHFVFTAGLGPARNPCAAARQDGGGGQPQ